jgi:methionyl-tRNA formyltransferase
MRSVVFMGSPDFAIPALQALIDSPDYDVKLVVSQTDKPQGRKQILTAPPVKQLALQYNIPVYQPKTLRTPEALETIGSIGPDFIVVAAYGKILPQAVLDVPKFGCVNLHGSLLPKYRGAAPIQWAVLNGDKVTGVTTMYLANEMDTGDIIYAEETPIGEFETSGELYDRLKLMGAKLLSRTLRDIENGTAPRRAQDHDKASYVKMLDKSLCPLDFTRPARLVIKQICGLQPWPVATLTIGKDCFRVFSACYGSKNCGAVPGTILDTKGKGIEVACGDGESIVITELQAPGKKRMSAEDFLRGHPIAEGTVL